MDMSFLYSYKPALYPMNLSVHDQECSSDTPAIVPTLVDLCCRKIVKDADTTAAARSTVPTNLCQALLTAALQGDRDRSIEQLISRWPWPHLRLQTYSPAMFAPPGEGGVPLAAPYCGDLEMCEHMRRGVKQTTCLAHSFIECLKRHSETKLRCLDLTGYPAAEVIVNYLASHVLLVYNEVRQKEIMRVYDAVTRNLPADQRRHYSLTSTIPDEQFVICVDALIQTEDAHMELCRALRVSRSQHAMLRLRVNKLDISGLGVPRTVVLLEQLEPEYLTAISLQFNAISNEGLHVLCPALQPFTRLCAVDLASNGIVLTSAEVGQPSVTILADALGSLPHLVRLNLSGTRMRECVHLVLASIAKPLTMLRLSACGLRQSDIVWLSSAYFTSELEELDIGANNLSPYVGSVCVLLDHCSATLAVLEVEDSELTAGSLVALLRVFQTMPQLRYVNVALNDDIGAAGIIDSLEPLVPVPRLRAVRLSAPNDIAVPAASLEAGMAYDDLLRVARTSFAQRLSSLMFRLCNAHHRSPIKLIFKM